LTIIIALGFSGLKLFSFKGGICVIYQLFASQLTSGVTLLALQPELKPYFCGYDIDKCQYDLVSY